MGWLWLFRAVLNCIWECYSCLCYESRLYLLLEGYACSRKLFCWVVIIKFLPDGETSFRGLLNWLWELMGFTVWGMCLIQDIWFLRKFMFEGFVWFRDYHYYYHYYYYGFLHRIAYFFWELIVLIYFENIWDNCIVQYEVPTCLWNIKGFRCCSRISSCSWWFDTFWE